MKIKWEDALTTAAGVIIGMTLFSFLDKFVLSRVASHLENLIGGEDENE